MLTVYKKKNKNADRMKNGPKSMEMDQLALQSAVMHLAVPTYPHVQK